MIVDQQVVHSFFLGVGGDPYLMDIVLDIWVKSAFFFWGAILGGRFMEIQIFIFGMGCV